MARKEGASVFRGNSQKKRGREWERERKKEKKIKTRGDQASSVSKAHFFTFKRDFYTLSCTEREMKDAKSYRVSPNITSVLPLSKPRFFFSAYLSDKQYCVHYLQALEACEHFMTLFR